MNVTLRQLRLFLAVARLRSFSRAGDAVGLSQPAVSQAIGMLEAQLGLRVLDRTTREVVLTDAGRALADRLARIVDDLDQAFADVAGLASGRGGTVRVGSSPTLSANLMPDCIATCGERTPDVRIVLLDRIQEDVLARVRDGELDFGVVVEPRSTDDFEAETIEHDPFVLVLPPAHPLAARRRVAWTALDGAALVLLDQASGSRRLIDEALARHGVRCDVVQELGHPTTVFRMVERGIAISVMPGLAVPLAAPGRVAIRPLAPRVERRIMLVRRRNRALSPAAGLVWALVGEVARRRRAEAAPARPAARG